MLTLSSLQSQSLIQLPETDETDLIDPKTFKVFNEQVRIIISTSSTSHVSIPFQMTQELDLNLPLCDHPYIVSGLGRGATPSMLVLQSDIFMSANQVVIKQLTDLRRTSTE